MEPTGNARFATGNTVSMRIMLNNGDNTSALVARATTTSPITVVNIGTGASNVTGIRSTSSAQQKDFICLYDNTAGTGRPLAATFVESDGTANTTGNSYVAYYGNNVNTVSGAWGTIMPNTNANGVRRIESRSYNTGNILCFETNASSFTGTVNPTGGATEVVITGVPLDCSYITMDHTGIAQTSSGNIAASTNENILANFRIEATNATNTLNAISFTIGGSFIAGDVTNFNLYTSTGNSFPGGTPLKTIAAGSLANGVVLNFNALAQGLSIGSRYFWITADLSASGTGRNIIVPALVNGDFSFDVSPTSVTNNLVAGGTKTIVAVVPDITLAYGTISAGTVAQNSTNNVLYRVDVTVSTVAAQLNQVSFTTGGAYAAADISNLQLWYSSSPTFSVGTSTSIATKSSGLGAGTHTFSSLTQNFPVGTNYLYVTANLSCATLANTIQVNAIANGDFSFAFGTPTGSGYTNGGTQTVTEATPANVTGATATPGNTIATINWTNPSCFSEIMIVAKSSAFTAVSPTGDGSSYTHNSNNFTDGLNSAFDGGVVVYKGTTSPQTITGLTNGTAYNFKIFSRNGNSWSNGVVVTTTPLLVLNPGDIQIAGMNTSAPDGFTWVSWVTIPAGTQIKFTDGAFLSSASANAANNFRGGENYVTWSHTSDITPGTVIRMVNTSGSITTVTGGGTATGALNGLSGSGDQIFVYTGADPTAPNTNPTTFNGSIIFGATIGTTGTGGGQWLTTGTATANNSYLPSELNVANANLALTTSNPNAQYTAARNSETSLAAYKPMVMNVSNWTFSSSNLTLDETDFTLYAPGLIISEIMYDSPGLDEEWIELYNGSGSSIDLQGYQISNTNPAWTFTFPSSFVIVSGQYITVQVGTNGAFPFTPDVVAYTTSNNLTNTGSTISLINLSSVTIDYVTYSNSVLAAAAGNGATLEVTDVNLQNSNFPTNWQTSAVMEGSPSAINSTGVSVVFSRGTGNAFSDAIWSSTAGGNAQTIASLGGFASNRDIVIQSGNAVQFGANASVKNLTVQSGGTLWRNNTLSNQMVYMNVYGTTVQLDGTVGNGSTFDAIGLNIEGANTTIQGNGTVNLARIRKSNNTNIVSNLVINKNLNLTFPGTALYNNTGAAATFNVTVNASRVIDFKGNSHLSVDGIDGRNGSTRYGTFTINGTLNNIDTIFALTDNNSSGTTAITIGAGGTINAKTVMVALAPNATLYYTGNGGPVTSNFQFNVNGTLNVFTRLELQSGNFAPVATVRLKSTSVNDAAYLDNFTTGFAGTYTGQISAERFYAASLTFNQHFMGSPVNTPALSQFGVSGSPGFIIPTSDCDETRSANGTPYGTVFDFVETNGVTCGMAQWKVLTTGNAQNAKGYSVLKPGTGVFTVTGTPNLDSEYSLTGLTNSNWTNSTKQNRPLNSGWHLVSNPYPSSIRITHSNPGFDDQIMIWRANGPSAGSYQAEMVGSPTAIIPAFGAFMVHKTSAGGGGVYKVYADDRVTTSARFYREDKAGELKIVAVNNTTGLLDNTTIAFNADATAGFDPKLDANKFGSDLSRHTLYTISGNNWMSINTLSSITETNAVPVCLQPGVNGSYTFSFDGINSFDPTTYITLEDKKMGRFHNVRNGNYTFTANAGDDWKRFELHFTPAMELVVTDAACHPAGTIQLTQPGSANWNVQLSNSNNQIIASGTLNENSPQWWQVSAGTYLLKLTDASGYTVMKNIQVQGSTPVSSPSIMMSEAYPAAGEAVIFTAQANGADRYEWNFGDGQSAQGEMVNHTFENEGWYDVTLIVSNAGGCSSESIQPVRVTQGAVTNLNPINSTDDIKVWSNENTLYVFNENSHKLSIRIYNMLGQELFHEYIGTTVNFSKQINSQSSNHYLVQITKGNEVFTSKIYITSNQ